MIFGCINANVFNLISPYHLLLRDCLKILWSPKNDKMIKPNIHYQNQANSSKQLTVCVCVLLQVSPVLLPDSFLHETLQGCIPHVPPLQQSPARREEEML